MNKKNLKIFLIIISYNFVNGSEKAPCTIKNSGASGTCIDINDCLYKFQILKEIGLGNSNETFCQQENGIGYICCPDQKSLKKCQEYAKFVYENETEFEYNAEDGTISETIKSTRNCFALALIIGGSPARAAEFPHMAAIGNILPNNTFNILCGGTLISEKYILTAAHCTFLKKLKREQQIVRLGALTINNDDDADEDPEDFNITEFIPHPEYKPPSKYNDIALIKLDRNVKFNKYKRPACLSTQINTNIEKVIASGWGPTSSGLHEDPMPSSILQKVTLDKFSYSDCYDYFKRVPKYVLKYGIEDSTQICYGSKTERKDTCRGDSGGPIQIRHQSYECMYEIIGITSTAAGSGCGVPGSPAIYTRLYPYIPWIEKTIWN